MSCSPRLVARLLVGRHLTVVVRTKLDNASQGSDWGASFGPLIGELPASPWHWKQPYFA